ncbi:MAG: Exodeoxyribonuclease 7 large subunit [Acidimicrobiales bacterium]|nr:Exodeoxyribonuclease 7 large subunit [Acidimicrobiales bacterium]
MVNDAHTFEVGELNRVIGRLIEDSFPGEVWVQGEIANLSRSNAGHAYFQLIEPSADRRTPDAAIPVALFDSSRRRINAQLRKTGGVRMTDGIRIRVRGTIEYYGPQGRVQLRMSGIDPEFTVGRLAAERERLLRSLAGEGLLRANASVPTPLVPLRVALVTSRGSAAQADFIEELGRGGYAFEVSMMDARVQGPDSQSTVTAALRSAALLDVDVVAVVRGGGARTDLAAFDSEPIARAIAESPLPVWTGIGHETDRTVADEVAHTAYRTPTACAAGLVGAVGAFIDTLVATWQRVVSASNSALSHHSGSLRRIAEHTALASRAVFEVAEESLDLRCHRLARESEISIDRSTSRLRHDSFRLQRAAEHRLTLAEGAIMARASNLVRTGPRVLDRAASVLAGFDARCRAYDPVAVLARGYSLSLAANGSVVRSVNDLSIGDGLVTRVADGSVHSRVTGKQEHADTIPTRSAHGT